MEEHQRSGSPLPSLDHPSATVEYGSSTHPGPPLSPPHSGTQGVGSRPELVSVRPEGLLPSADPPQPARDRPVAENAVVEPLWSRGVRQEAVTFPGAVAPPKTGQPSTASGGGPAQAEPPAAFPTPPGALQDRAHRRTNSTEDSPYRSQAAQPSRFVSPPSQTPLRPEPVRPPEPRGSQRHRRFTDRRHSRLAGVFGLGAVSGLVLASSLLSNGDSAPATPPASLEQPDRPLPENPAPAVPSPPTGESNRPAPGNALLPEIPGTGLLRQGDTGHGVYELQVRLLQIPHVYDGGAINGRFDTNVRQAVGRFQNAYGIHGDEIGVYGDNTRHALMLRTK
ncbi:peptidoglycan-binding protein [Streptomyces sp. DH10]|uniref:peptidoglycan-binding protein n=1 Tax=Streptomyces sp. DH10 TaxID=3040121 RepID=UPI0024417B8B|nr:peptidoglycan-binding protein [Streptomyces sp. DH10]MDG9710574.1 peptidoglycan-binding protein [Streptomyces sp. DH10]